MVTTTKQALASTLIALRIHLTEPSIYNTKIINLLQNQAMELLTQILKG